VSQNRHSNLTRVKLKLGITLSETDGDFLFRIQVAVQDFLDDGELLLSLHNFIKELELDGYTGLAAQLQKNLNTKIDEVTTNAEKYFFLRARFQDDGASSSSSDPDLGRPANDIGEISILTALSTNPFPGGKDYFMDMTHEDIAKYLTTVESALFRSIQVRFYLSKIVQITPVHSSRRLI
jgi:hypothetical protein